MGSRATPDGDVFSPLLAGVDGGGPSPRQRYDGNVQLTRNTMDGRAGDGRLRHFSLRDEIEKGGWGTMPEIRRDKPVFVPEYDHNHALHAEKGTGFGAKTIGFFGGFALTVNNITGPGMVQIPALFQNAGWVFPTLVFLVTAVISSFASTMLCEAMASVPGNHKFDDRVELASLARFFFPRWAYFGTALLLVFSLFAMEVASVIVAAQTMDLTLVAIKGTCGLELYPQPFHFECFDTPGSGISPFGDVFVVSLGFVVVMAMSVPLGYFNLDDNIIVQKISFIFMIVNILSWFVLFFDLGLDFSRVPAFAKDASGYAPVLGSIIFNYAYVTTVPSWVNEKKDSVSVNKTVWWGSALSTLMYLAIGLLGAWTFTYVGSADLLDEINDAPRSWLHTIAVVNVYVFNIVCIVSGIPVYSIIIRYNLVENELCNKHVANVLAVLLPWLVGLPFFTGNGLANVINWTSLFVNGIINFIIPILLYMAARRFRFLAVAEADEKHQRAAAISGRDDEGMYSDPESGDRLKTGISADHDDVVEAPSNATEKIVELKKLSFAAYPEAAYPMQFAGFLVVVFSAAIVAAIALTFQQVYQEDG